MTTTDASQANRLRVLVASDPQDRLAKLATLVISLGHDVIATHVQVDDVGLETARTQPDVAVVALGQNSENASELIERVVEETACPVVALLREPGHGFAVEVGQAGVFAYVSDGDGQEPADSIEIVLRRFAEFRELERALKRRAITERARGILMERHAVNEEQAFGMLRDEARRTHSLLVDTAQSIIDGKLRTADLRIAEAALELGASRD
jgi:response regulator NasT